MQLRRPIWVFVGRTCQKVRFLTFRLKPCSHILLHRCIVNCFICSRLCVLVLQKSQTRSYITVLQICWVVWWTLTCCSNKMCRNVKKGTFWYVLPTKTQIRLRIRAVWLESSLSAWKNFASLAIQNAPSKESDQTAGIFTWRTCLKVRFLMLWLKHIL